MCVCAGEMRPSFVDMFASADAAWRDMWDLVKKNIVITNKLQQAEGQLTNLQLANTALQELQAATAAELADKDARLRAAEQQLAEVRSQNALLERDLEAMACTIDLYAARKSEAEKKAAARITELEAKLQKHGG